MDKVTLKNGGDLVLCIELLVLDTYLISFVVLEHSLLYSMCAVYFTVNYELIE